MKYDFETVLNRKNKGSGKWIQMYKYDKELGDDIIPLSVADMEFKVAPEIIDGLKDFLDDPFLGYARPTEEYLESVVSWMDRRHDFKIEKDWIVNTPGIVTAFFNAIRTFSEEGEGVIIMTPVYYPFFNSIEKQNRKLVDCPLIEEDGNYRIDFDLFEELSRDKNNKILLFCSPHNPVGRVWRREELEKLGEIILKNDLLLLSDEIHFDLIMPGNKHTVFQTIDEELAEKTITFTAPTKTFNLAGMAISNCIIKNRDLRKKFRRGMANSSIEAYQGMSYEACRLAYDRGEDWLEECISVINENQIMVRDFFQEKHPLIKAPLIEGTYLQWIDFRSLDLTKEELESLMKDEAKLFLDEGYIFGKNGEGFERINLAAPKSVIEGALNRLDQALDKRGF